MNEEEYTHKLIGLKRFEMPPEGFVEDLLIKLHQRQRSELLHQSSLGLAWERMVTVVQHLSTPQWLMVTASASLMLITLVVMNSRPADSSLASKVTIPQGQQLSVGYSRASTQDASPIVINVDESGTKAPIREIDLLLGNHFRSGLPNESSILRSPQPAMPKSGFSSSPIFSVSPAK
jgi:hypothetical protein